MRKGLVTAAVAVVALAGCAGSDGDTSADATPTGTESSTPAETGTEATSSPTPSPTDDATEDDAVEIEIEGDKVQPNGRRLKVAVGEPVRLRIESDRAAELHVHSRPEQVVPVPAGESTVELTIDNPGVVDVEEHDSGIIVLQLEVR